MTTEATIDRQLVEARAAEQEAAQAHRDASAALSFAEQALGRWERESKLRRPAAHRGLDAALEAVPGELRRRLSDLYPKLCMDGVAAVSPEVLAELAALQLAATPAFAELLHELLNEQAPAGLPALTDMSDEEHARRREELRAERAELQRARAAAGEQLRDAQARVSRLELGHVDGERAL